MISRFKNFSVVLITLFAISTASVTAADVKQIVKDATSSFKDVTLTCKVVKSDQNELQKIGRDFARSYEFKTANVRFKSPDKMRMDGKLGMVTISIIVNGDKKVTSVPALHISSKDDLNKDPERRQSDMDIGIVSCSFWRQYDIKNVSEDSTPQGTVYRITYSFPDAKKGHQSTCWIDAKTLKLLKVENYRDYGKTMKSRFIFSNHTYVQGIIWVPGKIEVYNENGKLAGVTMYDDIKVNTGLQDNVFKL